MQIIRNYSLCITFRRSPFGTAFGYFHRRPFGFPQDAPLSLRRLPADGVAGAPLRGGDGAAAGEGPAAGSGDRGAAGLSAPVRLFGGCRQPLRRAGHHHGDAGGGVPLHLRRGGAPPAGGSGKGRGPGAPPCPQGAGGGAGGASHRPGAAEILLPPGGHP